MAANQGVYGLPAGRQIPPWVPQHAAATMLTGGASADVGIAGGGSNRQTFHRFMMGYCRASKIRVRIGTASGNVCFSLYEAATPQRVSPDGAVLLYSTGSITCPASGMYDIKLPDTFLVGPTTWFGASADNTTATYRGESSASTWGNGLITTGYSYYTDSAFPAVTVPAFASDDSRTLWHSVPYAIALP